MVVISRMLDCVFSLRSVQFMTKHLLKRSLLINKQEYFQASKMLVLAIWPANFDKAPKMGKERVELRGGN
jgi:hypothetical protein